MYKLCKTEQSAQRQRQLEEGLLTAMRTKRYEEITISDLCDQMGIPRKSFYRYFSGKDGALHALIDHTLLDFEQYSGILVGSSPTNIHKELRRFFEFWQQHRQLLEALGAAASAVCWSSGPSPRPRTSTPCPGSRPGGTPTGSRATPSPSASAAS